MALRPVEKRGPGGDGLGGAIGIGRGLLGLVSMIPGPQQLPLGIINAAAGVGESLAGAAGQSQSQGAPLTLAPSGQRTPLQNAASTDPTVQLAQMTDAYNLIDKAPVNLTLDERKQSKQLLKPAIAALRYGVG